MDYSEILDDIHKVIIGIPFPVISLWQNEVIERIRNNYNGEIFNSIQSLSLRKDIENIKDYGRVNTPKNTTFYGTMGFNNQDLSRATTVLETHKTLRTTNTSTKEQQIFTSGQWLVKDFLKIIIVPFHTLVNNNRLGFASKHFTSGIEENFKNFSSDILDLLKFFSDEFAKNVTDHNEYKLTAAFGEVFMKSYDLDGIIYPSVKAEYRTENIALSKKALSKIELFKAVMFELYINKDQVFIDFIAYTESLGENKNQFDWTYVDRTPKTLIENLIGK